ncbi:MAG TPA: hypothetical protein VF077_00540 [Nitrospiraceae bacterium]
MKTLTLTTEQTCMVLFALEWLTETAIAAAEYIGPAESEEEKATICDDARSLRTLIGTQAGFSMERP